MTNEELEARVHELETVQALQQKALENHSASLRLAESAIRGLCAHLRIPLPEKPAAPIATRN